jgi:hypothetical protein
MWPAVLAEQLRGRGHDVVAVLERDDLVHQRDEVIFQASQVEQRAVFTEKRQRLRASRLAALVGAGNSSDWK